ncbi:hypothetical protein CTA2_9385 [Colletotrichum tanaceti]|uniref:Uncharacterized protein n=1 Tax=Colletotrichum tanaceti TaxID=1306861 RepID=A0A4U6XPZ3_9PEZI|nr:hypothetical protein CTA2_9385 [Colletotrichum tanaceti]TKW57831.1 hypothetical protein CTA1_9792 [Colletotrichum tanaceti]
MSQPQTPSENGVHSQGGTDGFNRHSAPPEAHKRHRSGQVAGGPVTPNRRRTQNVVQHRDNNRGNGLGTSLDKLRGLRNRGRYGDAEPLPEAQSFRVSRMAASDSDVTHDSAAVGAQNIADPADNNSDNTSECGLAVGTTPAPAFSPSSPSSLSPTQRQTKMKDKQTNSPAGPRGPAMGSSAPQNSSPDMMQAGPRGYPTQNRKVSVASSGQTRLIRAQLHTDKHRRASVVNVPSPLKLVMSSSPPTVESYLRNARPPPSSPLKRVPGTNSTISVDQDEDQLGEAAASAAPLPSPRGPGAPIPRHQISSLIQHDPFVTSQPGPQTLNSNPVANSQPLSMAEKVAGQLANARASVRHGYRGPFDIGDYVCLIDPYTGEPQHIAYKEQTEYGEIFRDIRSKKDICNIEPSNTGEAMWGKNGEFKGLNASMPAEKKEAPALPGAFKPGGKDVFMGGRLGEGNDDVLLEEEGSALPSAFRPGGRDAFMGARLGEGNDDVLMEEEEETAPSMTKSGPTPYWMKEANETLGIPSGGDLFEYCDLDISD